jgi:hypothetical protein
MEREIDRAPGMSLPHPTDVARAGGADEGGALRGYGAGFVQGEAEPPQDTRSVCARRVTLVFVCVCTTATLSAPACSGSLLYWSSSPVCGCRCGHRGDCVVRAVATTADLGGSMVAAP